jgi:hypothetical protein
LLLAAVVAAACALFYGDRIDSFTAGYASWIALLAIPAALGGLLINLACPDGDLPLAGCFIWPSMGIVAAVGLAWALIGEGAICIAMVLPLWIPAAVAGALVNRWNKARADRANSSSRLNNAAWLAFPLLLATGDGLAPPVWHTREVTRETIVAASPEEIWPLLVSIPAIGPHEGTRNFTHDALGVPRPTSAVLVRRDGRPVRKARWGPGIGFEERVSEWRVNRSIGWTFAFPDDSIQQHTDRHVSPDGPVLKIEAGRYDLIRLGQGKTLVQLTTRYSMRSSFPAYLACWGELMLGDVQSNVLGIVQQRAESSHGI